MEIAKRWDCNDVMGRGQVWEDMVLDSLTVAENTIVEAVIEKFRVDTDAAEFKQILDFVSEENGEKLARLLGLDLSTFEMMDWEKIRRNILRSKCLDSLSWVEIEAMTPLDERAERIGQLLLEIVWLGNDMSVELHSSIKTANFVKVMNILQKFTDNDKAQHVARSLQGLKNSSSSSEFLFAVAEKYRERYAQITKHKI